MISILKNLKISELRILMCVYTVFFTNMYLLGMIMTNNPKTFAKDQNTTTAETITMESIITQELASPGEIIVVEQTQKTITKSEQSPPKPSYPTENCLNAYDGIFYGPSGKETYYNLPMNGVIEIMRNAGFNETQYPYWIREDGVKMFGDYVMVAANLEIHPRGSIVDTSLGKGIVCDTGEFIYSDVALDIAVDW